MCSRSVSTFLTLRLAEPNMESGTVTSECSASASVSLVWLKQPPSVTKNLYHAYWHVLSRRAASQLQQLPADVMQYTNTFRSAKYDSEGAEQISAYALDVSMAACTKPEPA